ncbi:MAG: methyltransferase domain-containing protein [Gammaproteobacteria bacterium]|nr:methyltransferase domain-containing protein [Gammaproteobacteria bacterium]MBQ0838345.1 methyltransferase domain-containing protein [Gammaproteobacteria bacterium]
MKANNLACPIDGQPLALEQRQLSCAQGHSFDLARQGYVNLLPVQHKRSKNPGDSKEMVMARQRFLNTGLYAPVAQCLSEMLRTNIGPGREHCVLDAGCGEGYYLDYALHYLEEHFDLADLSFIGLDISKEAIFEAAKRNKIISWLVGTNRQPPIIAGSVDTIVCVFGFHSFQGFHKIMRLGGKLILVEPGLDHLQELREVTYSEVKKSAPTNLDEAFAAGFTLIEEKVLRFKTESIKNQPLNDLLMMTPHFFRASKEGKMAAANLNELVLTVDMVFRTLEKTGLTDEGVEKI